MAERAAPGTYVKHAFLNQYNLIMLGGAALFSLVALSPLGLLAGLGVEIAVLSVIPGLAIFRRHVDRKLETAAREEAMKQALAKRQALVNQMTNQHQAAFSRLVGAVDQIRGNLERQGEAVKILLEDSLAKAERLTASYLRLAIAHKTYGEYLRSIDRGALFQEIQALEQAIPNAAPRVRELQVQRLEIAKKRAERWDKARENIEVITHQLATIEELVQLMHEQSIAPKSESKVNEELDRFMGELEGNEGTVAELDEFGTQDDAELAELELAREADAESQQRAGR